MILIGLVCCILAVVHLKIFFNVLYYLFDTSCLIPVFVSFLRLFLLRMSYCVPMWSDGMRCFWLFLNVLRLVLWLNIWGILEHMPHVLGKNVFSAIARKCYLCLLGVFG